MTEVQPLVYRVSEVCALLDLSKSKARRMIEAGDMPAVRYGRVVRIPRWWVDQEIGKGKRAA